MIIFDRDPLAQFPVIRKVADGKLRVRRSVWASDKPKAVSPPKCKPGEIQIQNMLTGEVTTFPSLDAYKLFMHGSTD